MLNIFIKEVPKKVPVFLLPVIKKLRSLKTEDAVLRESMKIVARQLDAKRIETYLFFPLIFRRNLKKIWFKRGFAHCTTLNYFVRCFLVWSGKFRNEDIKARWTTVWLISPHQYLIVRAGRKKNRFDIDPWGFQFGVPLGKHAWGFNQSYRPNE